MTEDEYLASLEARAESGELITVEADGKSTTVRQGLIDVMRKVHDVDLVKELKYLLSR